ncbi:MAG: repair protein RadA [Naasia sp.]|jgi:DNA repair protein RadA/Sms|uniref:DNA repair protein RadA n=1 Tax=Naasia sp. TaxID=2546198 RepID=UPI00260EB4AB|nr:DNA repair protein RadA [Naasia sp.]MCU1570921.1 repair protein RadA [Naasia sp.]
MARQNSAATVHPYSCGECGWKTAKWVGRCGECQQWGTVVESAAPRVRSLQAVSVPADRRARPISEIRTDDAQHWPSGIAEFDRVLGGGIVPGAAILLSGEPGVGKSTLLLEVASRAAGTGATVLYVTAEESVGQVRMRAERTGALRDGLYLAAETDLGTILGQIEAISPQLVIVDSVQTVSSADGDGLAGGPSQVREVASTLIRVAKDKNIPVLLVGHVTKDGTIAGPRLLEHLVDVVCTFEGDRHTALRFIRALKNRFGPTDEVGCFEMNGVGLAEVADPSGLFLSRTSTPVSGTCTTVAMEGRRALPVEVQALVVATSAPQPRRVTNGVDSSRVAMLLAVLERRAGVRLSQFDVYVSTVGGVRLTEPAADLAIALAVASAAADRPIGHDTVAVGEISLAGEIRPVSMSAQRISEAARMGFTTVLDSRKGTAHAALMSALR